MYTKFLPPKSLLLGFLIAAASGCSASTGEEGNAHTGRSGSPTGSDGSVAPIAGARAPEGDVTDTETSGTRTLVVEAGRWSTPHRIGSVEGGIEGSSKRKATVTFELSAGAHFRDGSAMLTLELEDGAPIVLPSLQLGEGHEASAAISIEGASENERLRLLAVPEGSIADLARWEDIEEFTSFGEHDALLDEEVVSAVLGECEDLQSLSPSSAGSVKRTAQALSFPRLCIRTPLGPGKVKWNNRSGFQVLPEGGGGSRPLQPATGSSQSVDAIWHSAFGCSFLKIPNHCTATVSSPSNISCCCNAATSVFEGRCRFTGPGEVGGRPAPGCR